MAFYKKKSETFKTTKFDILVIFVMLFVFYYALLGLSFKPLLDENGEPVLSESHWRETGDPKVPVINNFVIIGGLILCYEALLIRLEGKKRGRYLPWSLWYRLFFYKIELKIEEGKRLHHEWKNRKIVK